MLKNDPIYYKYSSATKYLRKYYNFGIFNSLGAPVKKIAEIKKDLVKNSTLSQLRSLRIIADTQINRYKQVNILVPIVVFTLTILITVINSFINTLVAVYDKSVTVEQNKEHIGARIKLAIEMYQFNVNIIFIIIILIFIAGVLYFIRYSNVSLTRNIINEAFEEKKYEEDRATRNKNS